MKNQKLRKALLLVVSALLLMSLTVAGTLAYLTSKTEPVTNTFSVGQVKIKLDEAKVNEDGKLVDIYGNVYDPEKNIALASRVTENDYHLLPGQSYIKDPQIGYVVDSDMHYLRMIVTITNWANVSDVLGTNIFVPKVFEDGANDNKIIAYDSESWNLYESTHDTDEDTMTYEFRYYSTCEGHVDDPETEKDDATHPDKLFNRINIPSNLDNDEMIKLQGMEINVVAHAMQAKGFDNADDAWEAFNAQYAAQQTN